MQSSDFCEGTRERESSSMRTSKNRSSRARYTCAGCATGRSGRVAVLLCFISLFFALFCLLLSPPPSSFHLPAYPAHPRPFSPWPSPPFPTAAAHSLSQELLFDCFITFINAAATRCYYYHSSCRGGRLLCWSTMAPLLLAERCEF